MEDEIDYNELFGVTPEDGGAEAQQEAGPAQSGPAPEPGEADQAEPSPQGEAEQGEPGAGGGQGTEKGEGENVSDSDTSAQSPAEDAPGAEAPPTPSPAAQQDAAKRAVDEAFANSGLKNPYTGQPITSKAEYDAYREQFAQERQAQLLKKSGMSQEEFRQLVQELPEVRQARQAQAAAEKAIREAREAAARVKVGEQLKEISAMDSSVKTLSDLAKMPTYPRFYELVQRGNTLTDAFRLANFDALAQRTAAGARQAAVNAARGKEHLTETRTRGRGAVSVPAEVREQYKLLNPDATDEEIQAHYQKYHKKEA